MAAGGFHTVRGVLGRYMKACHIAEVEVRSRLVQTVTSGAQPSISRCLPTAFLGCLHVRLVVGDGGSRREVKPAAHCEEEEQMWPANQMRHGGFYRKQEGEQQFM